MTTLDAELQLITRPVVTKYPAEYVPAKEIRMTKFDQVARAIADALNMDQNPHMYEPEDTLRAARAAVEVLREPTKEMVQTVMMDQMDDGPEAIWRAMVDSILIEKTDAD